MPHTKQGFLSIYFCGSEDCAPGHSFGPAIRPHYLLHIIRSGRGCFHRDGRVYRLQAGDAFLISPLESTLYRADSQDPWHYSWIGFDGSAVEQLLSATCFLDSCIYSCRLEGPPRETYFARVTELLESWQACGPDSYAPLGKFLEVLDFMRSVPAARPEGHADPYLQRAKDYIHSNYSYPIRVTDIAQAVGIDRTYLYRLFMERERVSPKQYLLRLRLRTALKLLAATTYSITEIAYYCGFHDSSAFCNQFKAHFGESPGSFRRRESFE